jgi:hypothetical protein
MGKYCSPYRRKTVPSMNAKTALLAMMTPCVVCLAATSAAASVLSGVVFVDTDMNGEWDYQNEWVLPNVYMRLTAHGDPTFSTEVSTDQYGRFQFTDLAAGVYDIEQVQILPQYISASIEVGTLYDITDGSTLGSGHGTARQYSQSHGIMPAVVSIEIPNQTTQGFYYNFGQIWWGKFHYVSNPPNKPPGANPPPDIPIIPEPSAVLLLAMGAAACLSRRRRAPGRRSR